MAGQGSLATRVGTENRRLIPAGTSTNSGYGSLNGGRAAALRPESPSISSWDDTGECASMGWCMNFNPCCCDGGCCCCIDCSICAECAPVCSAPIVIGVGLTALAILITLALAGVASITSLFGFSLAIRPGDSHTFLTILIAAAAIAAGATIYELVELDLGRKLADLMHTGFFSDLPWALLRAIGACIIEMPLTILAAAVPAYLVALFRMCCDPTYYQQGAKDQQNIGTPRDPAQVQEIFGRGAGTNTDIETGNGNTKPSNPLSALAILATISTAANTGGASDLLAAS